jgi:hypothetical protein
MPAEKQTLKVIVDEFGRAVVVTLYLVQYNAFLFVRFLLGEGRSPYKVKQQMQGSLKKRGGRCGIKDRLFLRSVGVHFGAYIFKSTNSLR